MNFSFVSGDAVRAGGAMLVIPLFDGDLGDNAPATLATADMALDGQLRAAATQEGFKGKVDQTLVLNTLGKLPTARVALLGLGARAKFTPEAIRMAAGRIAKAAQKLKATELTFVLPASEGLEHSARAVVEGVLLGLYRFDRYKTSGKDEKNAAKLATVRLALPDGVSKSRELEEAVKLGQRVAEAAKEVAKETGIKATIGGRREIEQLNMGMFLGVAQGSANEPRLIHLAYVPKNAKEAKRAPLALVGKAITFDSGGLSLKPADSMIEMKTDMAGSAAVLGAMRVIGALKPPFPVHAFIGACENMPSGTAYRPGDILTSRMGKTVEITNTDAEGRLVLGDILTWACEHKPSAVIDLATLTGACVIALGNYIVGAFGEHDATVQDVLESARTAGEELWRMPVTELQKDALRSEVADMKNAGERWGGAINASLFLKEFVGETPWVHLDIAGPSTSPKERGYFNKGATGVGVRTLVEYVRRRADTQVSQPEATEPATGPARPAKPKASKARQARG